MQAVPAQPGSGSMRAVPRNQFSPGQVEEIQSSPIVGQSLWSLGRDGGLNTPWERGSQPGQPPSTPVSERIVYTPPPERFSWPQPSGQLSLVGQTDQFKTAPLSELFQRFGLIGMINGSVLTLAPVLVVALATKSSAPTFVAGITLALSAGLAVMFTEARASSSKYSAYDAYQRGLASGLATFVWGLPHILPFLIPNIQIALALCWLMAGLKLVGIVAIQRRLNRPGWPMAIVQAVGGTLLVLLAIWFMRSWL
jgi:hypothetical protein